MGKWRTQSYNNFNNIIKNIMLSDLILLLLVVDSGKLLRMNGDEL